MTIDASAATGKLHKTKAGAKARKSRRAARERRSRQKAANPYASASRPSGGRVRQNRKAERFDVDQGRGWLIVRAQLGRFSQVVEVLKSAGCPVFEARREIRVQTEGKPKVTNTPMMGRTLFVGVEEPEYACLLAGLDYVHGILCRGEGVWIWADEIAIQGARPAVIPPAMMAKFADHITGHQKGGKDVQDFVETLFTLGDKVRVTDGPFSSFMSEIEAIDAKRGTYTVAVNIFGRTNTVKLAEDSLEAA